jgi:beta-phosphoglucomutase family hydrolase
VIFDMDGVLVDSADAHRRAWQALGEEVGVPFTPALFRQTFGQRNASIIPTWLAGHEQPDAQRTQRLGDRKEALYRTLVRQGAVRVYPGVTWLVDGLRAAGVKLAVASSGPRENVALLIHVIGVRDRIDACVSAEDVTEGKPHPEAFLRAAERLTVPPADCAVVEDSVHGIEAARRAGMLAVAVLTSTPREELLIAGADLVAPAVGALRAAELLAAVQGRHQPTPAPGNGRGGRG